MPPAKKAAPKKSAETKELLVLPTFTIQNVQKSYDVVANFDEVEAYLKQEADRWKDVAMTVEQAEKAKKEMSRLRIDLEAVQETTKKERFNGPKSRFDDKMKSLIAITGTVEKVADAALSAKDQERINELNEAFDLYEAAFQKEFDLRPEYKARVERPKGFYNKTAKEAESKENLRQQYQNLRVEQIAFDADVKLIDKSLEGYPEISRELMIGRLNRGETASLLAEWIEQEKKRIDDIRSGVSKPSVPSSSAPQSIGVKDGPIAKSFVRLIDKKGMTTDFPGKTVTKIVEMTYPVDCADALNELFTALKPYGITRKVVKKDGE